MRLRISVRNKTLIIIMLFGALFFSSFVLAARSNYRASIVAGNTGELSEECRALSRHIRSNLAGVRDNFVFVASNDIGIRDTLKKSNLSYSEFPEEENIRKIKGIDILWNKGVWERLEKGLTKNAAASVLSSVMGITGPYVSEIFLTDAMGALVATTKKTERYYFGEQEWWQRARKYQLGQHYFWSMDYDKRKHISSFILACAVVDQQGEFLGVLMFKMDKDKFFDSIFRGYGNQYNRMGIITGQGHLVYSFGEPFSDEAIRSIFEKTTLLNRQENRIIGAKGNMSMMSFSKIEGELAEMLGNSYVFSLRDTALFDANLSSYTTFMIFLSLVMMLMLYVFGFFIARKVVEPLDIFKRKLQDIAEGKLDKITEIRSGDEFEELARKFNSMLERLQDSMISKEYFNKIIQSMSDVLFVVNAYGRIELANKRACELLGYSSDELKGKEAVSIFTKKDRYVIDWGLKGLIEEGALKDKKIDLLTKTGEEYEVYLGTRSIIDSSGNLSGLVCLAKDLTEVSRLLLDLEKYREESERHKANLEKTLTELTENRDVMLSILEDTNESKVKLEETLTKLKQTQDELLHAEKMISLGQIAAGVAHEINNPLFVISGEAEMMEMEESLTQSVKESVHIIREQVARIGEIIKRLLEFSRKKDVAFNRLNLNELLEKSIELLKYQAKASGHMEISSKLSGEPIFVDGDSNQLHEVFINIMLNALQAMEEKGGSLTVTSFSEIMHQADIYHEGKLKSGQKIAVVKIEDAGPGMSKETIKRIFEPFYTTKKTGTGLGLSVCFGIIENHKGSIEVDSEIGKGTVFTVRLPIAKENKAK